jgi:hypothetical protein
MAGLPLIKKSFFLLVVALLLVTNLGAQTVKAENQSSDPRITTYVVPAITDEKILPTTSISGDYVSTEISLRACPGEYEPASFVIRANEDITSLEAEATELIGENGSIPSSNVDIRVVKCWYQAGVDVWDITHKLLTPELLLKDDSLVKVEDGENYLKLTSGEYVWISEVKSGTRQEIIPIEDLPVKDSATLQPVNIPAGTNKQFWVTLKVPDGSPAGVYDGRIELRTSTESLGELQLRLEVLPIELSEPYLTYSIYYRGQLKEVGSISSENKDEEQFRAELADMFNHGVTNPTVYQGFDEALLGEILAIRNEVGIGGPLYFLGMGITSYGNNLGMLRDTVTELIDFVTLYGITELYIYGVDEATAPEHKEQIDAVHEAGGKVFVACSQSQADALADILDLAIVSYGPNISLANKYHSYGNEIHSYANPQVGVEKPETYRRNFGLLLWQADYDGAMDYAYQDSYCNIWNDFDHNHYRDHVFAYPTMDGVIDTVQWEGWREGVDDVKYLTTLLDLIEEAKAEGEDTSDAENWLADLKSSNLATKDLDAVRSEMIGYILSFLGGTPSDTTPPVITSVAASNINGASATISWFTDEPATSQVEYGETEVLGLSTDLDTTLVTNHSVTLTNLTSATTYYYKVKSRDAAGNLAASEVYNFTTLSPYLSISFIPPTDADNAVVNRNWTEIDASIDSTLGVSSFIDWNKSLVGYWNFNENSGSTAHDKSTYSNDGTLNNNPQWTNGKFGNALEFDGVDDYVDCGSDPSLDITNEITIEVWINPATAQEVCGDGETGNYGVAGKAEEGISGTVWSWQLRYGSPDNCRLGFQFNGDPEGSRWVTVKQNLTPGEWYHIVGTFDGTDIKCYLNGALKDTNQISGIKSSNAKLFIAEEGWHDYFHGLIDEVRIYNRALSPEEIIASYNTNLHSLSHKFTNLADGTYEYYAYATDLSGNSAGTETRTLIIDTILPDISNATLEGHVTFTERGSNNTKWAESFNVTLFEAGNLSNVLWTGNAITNNIGVFTVSGLTPGTYDIEIKNWTCLSELVTNQILTAGNTAVVNFGTTREGDANNDDRITILDASSLASSYGSSEGDPDWNPHCDFNRDGNISILDASAMVSNYGQDGGLA